MTLPFWPTPDAFADSTISSYSVSGNMAQVKVGIINLGDAAIGPPVYVTLYRQSVAAGNDIAVGSVDTLMINKGDTGYVTVPLDMTAYPVVRVIAKVNDNRTSYLYQSECDSSNNLITMTLFRPMHSDEMRKDATLLPVPPATPVQNNGTYSNPVSALYSDTIEYRITAVNVNINSGGTLIIRDTLPAYLNYIDNPESASDLPNFMHGKSPGVPQRDALTWVFGNVPSLDTVRVSFKALLESGVSASQPLFVNRAWATVSDTLRIPTVNSTYHQGAGVSTVTFSISAGGEIYNATPQALDFRTSPRSGILVVPNEGYLFAGWSHDAYISLRGETVEARSGIMRYDTLVIYGNVELRADFTPEEYPVRYHLHGGENPATNPPVYTIESAAITLDAPDKPGDVFTGWTGTNGDEPQLSVVIPRGSIGERDYYANYLYSGREEAQPSTPEDKIWSFGDELHVRTSKAGSIVRVYSPDGMLHRLQTIVTAGETRIKLPGGIYIVTLNSGVGQKVVIEK